VKETQEGCLSRSVSLFLRTFKFVKTEAACRKDFFDKLKYLIRNTTRAQWEKIVRDSLSCGGGGCESCSACGIYSAGDPMELYRPYIDGEKELPEITLGFRSTFVK